MLFFSVSLVQYLLTWCIPYGTCVQGKTKADGVAGGHTAEMLTLVGHMDKERYSPRCYVVAETDKMGAQKAWTSEGLGPSGEGEQKQVSSPRV
jgi:hypothetical protein